MNAEGRDELIAQALRDLPVPGHRDSFWTELDAALHADDVADPTAAAAPPPVVDDPPVHRLDTGELPSVTALAPERAARRSRRAPILAAAAAVVILAGAVGAVLLAGGGDGDDDAELADGQEQATTTFARSETTDTEPPQPTRTVPTSTTVLADEGTASATVLEWLRAVGSGDVTAAAALTGPRSTAYLTATTDGVEAFLTESAEGYGAWIGAPDIEVEEFALGTVEPLGGTLTIVVVSGTNPGEGREGLTTDVFPVVDAGDGWRVEHLAFDPDRDRNIPIVQIPRAPNGQSGLGSMGADEAVEVIVPAAGTVVFLVDDEEPFRRDTTGVGSNDDPYARYDPPGSLTRGEHRLVVVGIGDDGTIASLAGPFAVGA